VIASIRKSIVVREALGRIEVTGWGSSVRESEVIQKIGKRIEARANLRELLRSKRWAFSPCFKIAKPSSKG
jgi:hypothetical protein